MSTNFQKVKITISEEINGDNFKNWLKNDQNAAWITQEFDKDTSCDSKNVGADGSVKILTVNERLEVALKIIKFDLTSTESGGTEVDRQHREEYEILAFIRNPFIVKYYGSYLDFGRNLIFIFMEYCDKSNLTRAEFDRKEIPTLFAQICLGLACLHNKNIFHRDLKPQNILLTKGHVIKIADFGRAKIIGSQISTANSAVGTMMYMAPEILKAHIAKEANEPEITNYHNTADIWSLGCVLRFLVDQKHPFDSEDDVLVGNYKPLPDQPHVTAELKELLHKMLQLNPNDRPNIDEILNDSFVTPSLFYIYKQFPQLKNPIVVSSEDLHYVPEIDDECDATENWERMKPVQTLAADRISVIDLSQFPRDDRFKWIFDTWREMVVGEFNESVSLFLPPVRLPSDDYFSGCLVDIKLIRRFTRGRASRDLRMHARYSPYPRNPETVAPFPLKCVCNISISSGTDDRVKPPTDIELKNRDDFSSWFIFHDFRWDELDKENPPIVRLSFSAINNS